MRKSYPIYRKKNREVEKKLPKEERIILDKYVNLLLASMNKNKARQHKCFILQLRDITQKPLNKINRDDIIGFWGLVNQSEHEHNTKCMIRKSVKRFLKNTNHKLYLKLDDLKSGEMKPNRKKTNKVLLLTADEIDLMIHQAETLREKCMIMLMYESACRPEELVVLKWRDVNWTEKEIHLDSNKTERDRNIPLDKSLLHLRRWKQEWRYPDCKELDYIFPSRRRDKGITTRRVAIMIKDLSTKAGIERNITPYLFRHSRLTDIYVKGVKGLEHNKFAGHKPGSKQQATYTHIDNQDMKFDVLNKVYNIEELSSEKKHELEEEVKELKEFMNYMLEGRSNPKEKRDWENHKKGKEEYRKKTGKDISNFHIKDQKQILNTNL